MKHWFSLPVTVTVYDFELPVVRHLQLVGRLGWDRLEKLYPEQFETFTPMLINRREGRLSRRLFVRSTTSFRWRRKTARDARRAGFEASGEMAC